MWCALHATAGRHTRTANPERSFGLFMILCLTPNPAIDRTLYVDALRHGEVQRAKRVLLAAGGKGLNVARTIHTLGGEQLCMGPIGGQTGKLLSDLAQTEGLTAQWTQVRNETRTCTILVPANQDATVINESGHKMNQHECDTLIEDVLRRATHADLICISGSLLPGFSQARYRSLLAGLVAKGKLVWVDTSGVALKTALKVRGICIKVNAAELGDAIGMKISNVGQTTNALQHLRGRGVFQIAVTLGSNGAVLGSDTGTWVASAPRVEIVSSVGSGDAFLGGLLFGMESGASPETALRKGVAAGTANALEFGGGKFSLGKLEMLYKKVKIVNYSKAAD
ncbi:MAG: 1-phosphofructokinase family hexose kinase [Chloroflexota bacterium]